MLSIDVWEESGLQLEPMETAAAEAALWDGLDGSQGVERWVDAGTLLGIVRDGALLPHDTDIDIALGVNMEEALSLRLPFVSPVRIVYWNGLPMQYACRHRGVIIDYYFYYTDIVKGHLVNANTDCVIEIPASLVLPLDTLLPWRGGCVPLPAEAQAYLEWTFGGDWRVPKATKNPWPVDRPHAKDLGAVDLWPKDSVIRSLSELASVSLGRLHDATSSRREGLR